MPLPNGDGGVPVHVIGGRTFKVEELAWGQMRWLYQRLKGYPIHNLTVDQTIALFAEELSGILSIILVEGGQTRAEKILAGQGKARELELWLDANLTPSEAVPIIQDFFASGLLAKAVGELSQMLPQEAVTGSSKPLSSSQVET